MEKLMIIILLISSYSIYANDRSEGLFFYSHLNKGTERTGVILNDDVPFSLKEEETLSFDMWVRPEIIFGYVARIITDTHQNIDLVFSVGENDVRYPSLVVEETIYPLSSQTEVNRWIPVEITLSPARKQVSIVYGDKKKIVPFDFSSVKNIKIAFGTCSFPLFEGSDAAPVNIKNIKVYEDKQLIRHWQLAEHCADSCLDEIKHIPVKVTNPKWLIDDHIQWKKVFNQKIGPEAQFAFDAKRGIFYITSNKNNFLSFHTYSGKVTETLKVKGYPAGNVSGQMIFTPATDQLISYSLDEKRLSFFDFARKEWSEKDSSRIEHRFYNHAVSFNKDSSVLYSFGGYGFYLYNNVLNKIDLRTRQWQTVSIPEIDPRYSPSSVVVKNTLYIFGGRGCKSGRQEMSPHNYYDLYAVDLDTHHTVKLFDIKNIENYAPFLPASNMIFNPQDSCFYMFTNREGGQLLRFSLSRAELEEIGLPIGENTSADVLRCNLYYSAYQQKLYALLASNFKSKPSEVSIYSINYPPLRPQDIVQIETNNSGISGWMRLILSTICGGGGGTSIFPPSLATKEKTYSESICS